MRFTFKNCETLQKLLANALAAGRHVIPYGGGKTGDGAALLLVKDAGVYLMPASPDGLPAEPGSRRQLTLQADGFTEDTFIGDGDWAEVLLLADMKIYTPEDAADVVEIVVEMTEKTYWYDCRKRRRVAA